METVFLKDKMIMSK